MVVVGHTPGPWVQIIPLGKANGLGRAIQLGKSVTATQCPSTATSAILVFQHCDLVARIAQLNGGKHACQACAQHHYGCARLGLAELDGAGIRRFSGMAQSPHGGVHGCATCHMANHGEEFSPCQRCFFFWHRTELSVFDTRTTACLDHLSQQSCQLVHCRHLSSRHQHSQKHLHQNVLNRIRQCPNVHALTPRNGARHICVKKRPASAGLFYSVFWL